MKVFEDAPVEWFQHFSRLLESGICVDPEQLQKLQQCMRAAQDGTEGLLEALKLSEGELHTSKTRHNEEVDALHQELISLEGTSGGGTPRMKNNLLQANERIRQLQDESMAQQIQLEELSEELRACKARHNQEVDQLQVQLMDLEESHGTERMHRVQLVQEVAALQENVFDVESEVSMANIMSPRITSNLKQQNKDIAELQEQLIDRQESTHGVEKLQAHVIARNKEVCKLEETVIELEEQRNAALSVAAAVQSELRLYKASGSGHSCGTMNSCLSEQVVAQHSMQLLKGRLAAGEWAQRMDWRHRHGVQVGLPNSQH